MAKDSYINWARQSGYAKPRAEYEKGKREYLAGTEQQRKHAGTPEYKAGYEMPSGKKVPSEHS